MIQFNDVTALWKEIESTALPKLTEFLRTGPYILKEQVELFEKEFSEYCNVKYAIGVSNGTDALKMAIQALEPNENTRVLIPANSHISAALAPAYFDLPIILIDCDQNYGINIESLKQYADFKREENIIVIVTHLYGYPVDVEKIRKTLPPNYSIIEDCSQAHGARINGQSVGTFGDIGIFSLYPTKNLGAIGDAGIIITNDYDYHETLKALRNYGSYDRKNCDHLGWNNRLDAMQALILREKLPLLDSWNKQRKKIAQSYSKELKGVGDIILPPPTGVHHLYPIRSTRRDLLRRYLRKKGIPTLIHYPVPIQQTNTFDHLNSHHAIGLLGRCPRTIKYSEELLSLPIHPHLKKVKFITNTIKDFYKTLSCIECGGHIKLMETDEGYICRWCLRKASGEHKDTINPTGRYRDTFID